MEKNPGWYVFLPKGSRTPQLSEASLQHVSIGSSVNGNCMFSNKVPISGSKDLGFTSKGSHSQENQFQGKTPDGLFIDPYAHPNMDTSTYTRGQGGHKCIHQDPVAA